MSTHTNTGIDAADICERLVGITPTYLQNFVVRKSFGLRASVNPGKVRTQRRVFNREDIFGIALVWMLFESGLRGDPLARILNDIAGTKKADANRAARKLLTSRCEYLVVQRQSRRPAKTPADKPAQETRIVRQSEAQKPRAWNSSAVELVIPVGEKFRDIEKRLEILFPQSGD